MDCVIPNLQFGFRKSRSCKDCVAILNLEIYNSFINEEYVGAMFLDIKSAYDNTGSQEKVKFNVHKRNYCTPK